jgi:osmotically-inducible protein OsmY
MRRRYWLLIGVLALAVLSAALLGLSGVSSDEENAQRRNDETVKSKIEKRLRMDDRLNWELLDVNVEHGLVTLYGEVKTPEEKGLAALLASAVPGVEGVTNSILVEPALAPDHKLAQAIWQVVRSVPALADNDSLRISVSDGIVKLEGTVQETIEKHAAERATQSVPGVTTVINLIDVKSKVAGENATEQGREKMLQEGIQVQP